MKKIGVLTTGGDAPGMNAAIRAVVRTALSYGLEVTGVERGFRGLYEKSFVKLTSRSVSGIINKGGTFLKTIRFPEFKEYGIRKACYENLEKEGIEGLVIIGGDGSSKGAYYLYNDFNFPVVLIPASIDNDLYGTDCTVGFDTAVNTAVSAIDNIRDTATSHNRTFVIEVMGRESGNLALEVALACGAEIVIIPEVKIPYEKIVYLLKEQAEKGKISSIIILAEGAGRAEDLTAFLQKALPEREIRYSVLGYIQRGGTPTYLTRALATRFGMAAVDILLKEKHPYMVGIKGNEIIYTPLKEVISNQTSISEAHLEIIKRMAI
ncbi:MAG: 6-phosphofructokinase [Candidatus Omnitrophica bacterium]|nr:6-phosphofructokinase [Candidatus Omnitrophota bacterium]MCM8777746.1 6-phosphofructokinase [Candidatus Omnitrophota bacterium]